MNTYKIYYKVYTGDKMIRNTVIAAEEEIGLRTIDEYLREEFGVTARMESFELVD